METNNRKKHFILENVTTTIPYKYPGPFPPSGPSPSRDRISHGIMLRGQIDEIKVEAEAAKNAQKKAGMKDGLGLQVEFESFHETELAFESLARDNQGIELFNVRHKGSKTLATVFVPDGKLSHFEKLIREYLERKRDINDNPRDHKRLINAIEAIRKASVDALWTDSEDLLPTFKQESLWWEVWLPIRKNRDAVLNQFCELSEMQGIKIAPGYLSFPERTVLLAKATLAQMQDSIVVLNHIAELRCPKETAEFFESLDNEEQHEWVNDLRERTQYSGEDEPSPHICVLDTGINHGHPLIGPALDNEDRHSIDSTWRKADQNGHGTAIAGLALFGDMVNYLDSNDPVIIGHRLESVKIMRHSKTTGTNSRHHGLITKQAIAYPEITAPKRIRIFEMAITAQDDRDRGRPTSWSAAIDDIAANREEDGRHPRLVVISAGNTEGSAWIHYPDSNESDGVHDPAQAWNALTVGSYTELNTISESYASHMHPVAPKGSLSPFSTTSIPWDGHWPFKPDVVFEGGNVARDSQRTWTTESLSLLTSHFRPANRHFSTIRATSASTALAARFSAQIMIEYPQVWPETVRALVVHSAKWTPAMEHAYLGPIHRRKKRKYLELLRRCGFGVPDIQQALWSVSNSLSMVIEQKIQPFSRAESGSVVLQDMHFHELPWPAGILDDLGDTIVEMRVTLSYFIEPNPSARGIKSRYRYESHCLRFDVKRPTESLGDFQDRINRANRPRDYESSGGSDSNWLIGVQGRHKGSIHSDIWQGTASELASRGFIGVYPATGWWKTRQALKQYNRAIRYALIVSIHAPEVAADLYTDIENQIAVSVELKV